MACKDGYRSPSGAGSSAGSVRKGDSLHKQSLSFATRIARTSDDLRAVCRVRALAYGHHVPQMRETLAEPDLLDADRNTIVVLCADKASGEAVGTARFQTNAGGPLLIEHSMSVPEAMRDDTRAEITRLSTIPGADPLVKLSLMKASYLFCLATQVRWMVICARSDALARQYERLGFMDVYGDERMVPMLHVGKLEHRVLMFNVTTAESSWRAIRHPLYEFMIETAHPDIQLFSTEPALPRRHTPVRLVPTAAGLRMSMGHRVAADADQRVRSIRPVLVS